MQGIVQGMTVAQFLVAQLQAWEVRRIFGVPGDTLVPFLDAIRMSGGVDVVTSAHEGAAAFMASAWAKLTGRIGVCMADAGPGSVQMLNGVYDAAMDRVPLLVITGELESVKIGTHWPQDADLRGVYMEATVFNHTLRDPSQLPEILTRALRMAEERQQPVRLGIPKDFWELPIGEVAPPTWNGPAPAREPSADAHIADVARMLNQSARPVIFVGQGGRAAGEKVVELAERLSAAIVHTMPATGIISGDHPLNMGVIGDFGTQSAADVVAQADLMLVIGSTWWQPKYVPKELQIVQIDRIAEHVGLLFPTTIGMSVAAEAILNRLIDRIEHRPRIEWEEAVQSARSVWLAERSHFEAGSFGAIHPIAVIDALSRLTEPNAVITLDVGANTFWFSRYFSPQRQRVLLSGHWRSMGFGLPAAIGAKMAAPDRQVVVLTGDGGLSMVMAELATAVRYGCPICIVLFRDGRFTEEEAEQERLGFQPFATRFQAIDWVQVATAVGAQGYRVDDPEQIDGTLRQAFDLLAWGRTTLVEVPLAHVNPVQSLPVRTGAVPIGT